ncbi:hypothetical protein FRX31_024723 [Thalictrum thalictroides]|uniref:Uncharacterized protein n=1 Tax=Thalictrum thalictroides TaxID=46969 RepID=A0A7J6VL96_THATH|nr:hypothetical protein FRX31_024723 [Thalictrum thalictroides]
MDWSSWEMEGVGIGLTAYQLIPTQFNSFSLDSRFDHQSINSYDDRRYISYSLVRRTPISNLPTYVLRHIVLHLDHLLDKVSIFLTLDINALVVWYNNRDGSCITIGAGLEVSDILIG